ncbi:MAG: HisA/HisF-related TIM barrel protein [Candidatus Hermodarchaeota archaeon]
MKNFKIIPVIDILNSKAVHAISGHRNKYKPLKSYLFQSSNPMDIIRILNTKFFFKEFYIADLDSILKKKPNFQILKEIVNFSNINVILDPGIVNIDDIFHFSKHNIKNIVLGLETIKSLKIINQSIQLFGQNNIIISFDLYNGKILSKSKEISNQDPIKLINNIQTTGVKNIIILDLYRVGQKIGGIPSLYIEILQNFDGNIFVGGGIKNYKDLLDYKEKGFSGVLIATALYDGTINLEKLNNFHFTEKD